MPKEPMQKDYALEILLKEHEEIVSLYSHESKIRSSLTSVYAAFNVGLASVIVVLIQGEEIYRMRVMSFLCFMGFLFSLAGVLLFWRNKNRISEWVKEGLAVEMKLREKVDTLKVFKICKELSKDQTNILYGITGITILWLLVAVLMLLIGMGLIELSFFP